MSQTETRATIARQDNMLGICHAIGTDFGFDPLYLRLALAVLIIVSPEAMLITYGTLGLIVLASRLLVRTPKPVAEATEAAVPAHAPMEMAA